MDQSLCLLGSVHAALISAKASGANCLRAPRNLIETIRSSAFEIEDQRP
jgi:hypothetical protein